VILNFAMSIHNTWNLVSTTSSTANLFAEGVFKTIDKEKIFDIPGGMKAKSDLNGKQAVKSTVDSKSGWPTKQELLVELKGTMTLLKGGMIQEDMEIPTEIVSETTYVITKK
jgi:outer membrane protease